MGILRLLIAFSSLILFVQAGDNGVIYYLENGHNFLKHTAAGSEFSETDVAASVAVLLGVNPPLALSGSSSAKLEELLTADPFHRPRRVVSLIVEGLDTDFLEQKNMTRVFGVDDVEHRALTLQTSKTAAKHLGGQNVRLESLNHPVPEDFDVEMLTRELQQFGISVESPARQNDGEEIVVLKSDGHTLQFDLSKRSEYRFVADLLSLSVGLKRAMTAVEEHNTAAELFFGTVTSLKALIQERADASVEMELLLGVVSKIFRALEKASKGKLVGVVTFPSAGAHHVVREMIGKHYNTRLARYLKAEVKIPQTVEFLSRRALAASVSIILIISALLGSWCLCYMPLTRDTLLYAGAKLD